MTLNTVSVDVLKKKRICTECVEDDFLQKEIKEKGAKGRCSYCKTRKRAATMAIDDFADHIERAFREHYELTAEDPYPFEGRNGDPVAYLMQKAAGIDVDSAEDVRAVLEDRNERFDRDADENPFAETALYVQNGVRISEYMEEWAEFRKALLTEARLFNRKAEEILERIFDGLENHATRQGKKLIVDAGPGCEINALYRARYFQNDDKLKGALKQPAHELGPPPHEYAVPGRMNARGIGVFYGATHMKVAVAEIRPPVGSRVLAARFKIIRRLKLLDLDAMSSVRAKSSEFEPGHLVEMERTAFLCTLSELLTQPVMPDDEVSEYLVTQAIADYLAMRKKPALDGIIYPSAQQGGAKRRNVVLFNKSARVKHIELPKHTDVDAYLEESDEEGRRPDYRVFIRKPQAKEKAKAKKVRTYDLWGAPQTRRDPDLRDPALRIELPTLKVHEIKRVRFESVQFPVSRHESQMSAAETERIEAREKEDEPDF